MNNDEFSNAMEQAYKDALKQADSIIANAEKIRRETEKELDATKSIHALAEKEAEKKVQEYFEGKQTHFMEVARTELLRDLSRKHLEAGKDINEIAGWLNVPPAFIYEIKEVMDRSQKYRANNKQRLQLQGNPVLVYDNKGRGGNILFKNGQDSFDMWWEFAGGDALVIVDIPSEKQWEQRTHLPLKERNDILTFIGEQVVEDQVGGSGSFVIGDNVITFYKD